MDDFFKEVKAAFPIYPIPSFDLVYGYKISSEESYEELILLEGKEWTLIESNYLQNHYTFPFWLSISGLHYYLPAIMIFSWNEYMNKKDIVLVRDIPIFSYCEHHIALMYDMSVSVAYIPKDKVLGLSKIARICDMASKRLQLQERIGSDIAEIMCEAAETEDVAVIIHGTHSCMSARGIKKDAASTVTTTFRGRFETDSSIQSQLTMMLHA